MRCTNLRISIAYTRLAVDEYVYFHNHDRPHYKLAMKTPYQVEEVYAAQLNG